MAKNLQDILRNVEYSIGNTALNGGPCNTDSVYIEGIAFDSRKVKDNYLFVAEKGEVTDGHLYIDKAISNGAKVIIFDNDEYHINDDSVLYLKVKSSSLA